MGEVRWTAEAAHWLHEIHEYIAQDNPEAALRTVRGIHRMRPDRRGNWRGVLC